MKGRIALQAGHASPVKWCLNEKALDASSGSGLTQRSPTLKGESIYRPYCLVGQSYTRRNVDLVVRGTPGGAQGRSSWEGGAPKAQYRLKAGKKKKTRKAGLFFWFPLR